MFTSTDTAHVHHAWETYNRYGRSPAAMKRAAFGTGEMFLDDAGISHLAHHRCDLAFQFTYTSIFGFYCSYLFLRTGSIFPPITAHMFCNVMGVPQPGYDISERPDRKLGLFHSFLFVIVIMTPRANSHRCRLPHGDHWLCVRARWVDINGGYLVLELDSYLFDAGSSKCIEIETWSAY